MRTYEEDKRTIMEFIEKSGINATDLARISKDICSCCTCKYFIQHYLKTGQKVECGHCIATSTTRVRKPNQPACGHWKYADND